MGENWQYWEEQILAPWAMRSALSAGRDQPEPPCPLRTVYQRDRDRIIHSKGFRRLKHKTQVFVNPTSDHFRTRLTHTLEVTQISRTIARALSLNEDLTEAIALGHDLGHTPFGHAGERALEQILGQFSHNRQSLRVVEQIERGGKGLNLTVEVRDGILHHSGEGRPATLEGMIVRLSDRIAYINHDIDDALRANILRPQDLPPEAARLGASHSQRIDTLVHDVVRNSQGQNQVSMSPAIAECMESLRDFLFATVYFRPEALAEEEELHRKIKALYEYFLAHPQEIPPEYPHDQLQLAVADYIAGMTDPFALAEYQRIYG